MLNKAIVLFLVLSISFPHSSLIRQINYTQNSKDVPINDVLPFKTIYYVVSGTQAQYNNLQQNVIQAYHNLLIKKLLLDPTEANSLKKSGYQIFSKSSISHIIPTQTLNQMEIRPNSQTDATTMNVSELWNLGYNGTGTVVAVFDNGIQFGHPALTGQNYTNAVLFNNDPNGNPVLPCRDHGTPVAGLIAATGNDGHPEYRGNAFGSKLISLEFGCGANQELVGDAIGGLEWIAANHNIIDVLNLSWSAGFGFIFQQIIDKLSQLGINVIVSAGNYGSDPYTIGDPGSAVSAITVGASDYSSNVASFSSRGPTTEYTAKPDVIAPGTSLTTTSELGGYKTFSGTSGSAPLVSGAVATLISALNSNNIQWNTGTIKAAIMKTATPKTNSQNDEGRGMVNILGAWNLLNNLQSDVNGPEIVLLSPSSAPSPVFQTIHRNIQTNFPITMISSHPTSVSLSISGNISQILSMPNLTDHYSQNLDITVNTKNVNLGVYTGTITASLGNDSSTTSIQINVDQNASGSILMDLGHTNWDESKADWRFGTNNGGLSTIASNQHYFITETRDPLTYDYMKQFDILWMPDPLDIVTDPLYSMNPLTDAEIGNITEYVMNGGSLFMDFNGVMNDTGSIVGTNSTQLNRLLTNFGITANTNPVVAIQESVIVENIDPLVENIDKITHYGNFLSLDCQSVSLANNQYGSVLAYFAGLNTGKVLISATNFWLDNTGSSGGYAGYGGVYDSGLSNLLWNWLKADPTYQTSNCSSAESSSSSVTGSSSNSSSSLLKTSSSTTNSSSGGINNTSFVMLGAFFVVLTVWNRKRKN